MNTSRVRALGPLTPIEQIQLRRGDWLTAIHVAHYVGCCLDTVYRAIKRGDLRAVRMGRRWRIRRDWVDEGFLRAIAVR